MIYFSSSWFNSPGLSILGGDVGYELNFPPQYQDFVKGHRNERDEKYEQKTHDPYTSDRTLIDVFARAKSSFN